MEQRDELLQTGNTPPPEDISSKKSPSWAEAKLDSISDFNSPNWGDVRDVSNSRAILATASIDRYSPEDRGDLLSSYGNEDILIGRKFNYEYMGPQVFVGDDNEEIQAQRQGAWATGIRGIGRLAGEFAINVAEMPGVLGGAIAGLATWDSSKLTDNFWVKFTDSLKDDLHDNLSIYQKKAVTNGSVLDHFMSGAWWASEGASGIAFMGAALIPGLGFSKLPKMLSITKYLGGLSTRGAKVLAFLDKSAETLKLAERATKGLTKAAGTSAKSGIDLFNFTMANTVYEAGVEAKSAKDSYEELILNKLNSGNISQDEYDKLSANSGYVASQTFGLNMALLLIPNAIVSRQLLGPRPSSLLKAVKKTKWTSKGLLEKRVAKTTDITGNFFKKTSAKLANSSSARNLGKFLVRGVEDTFREGIVEEGGQSAITDYYGKDYMDYQLTGERGRGRMKTYFDVLNSTEGQVAAIFAGILSAPMSTFGHIQEKKAENSLVDNLITSVNLGTNLSRTKLRDWYKEDPDNKGHYLLENGALVPDVEKIKALGDAKIVYDEIEKIREKAEENGDFLLAESLSIRGQIDAFLPFIQMGDEGIEILKERMENDPAYELYVNEHKRQTGEKITVKEVVAAEIEKAVKLKEDLNFYKANIMRPTSKESFKEMGIESFSKDEDDAVEARDEYNELKLAEYINHMGMSRFLKEKLTEVDLALEVAKQNKQTDVEKKLKKDKRRIVKSIRTIENNITEASAEETVEKNWLKFFKQTQLISKVNSKETTDYLDDFIKGIKRARSISGVMKIVKKAQEEGLILPEITPENLPKEILQFSTSDNILEAIAASQFFRIRSQATMARRVDLKAREENLVVSKQVDENLDRIYDNTEELLNKAVTSSVSLRKEIEALEKETTELSEELGAHSLILSKVSGKLAGLSSMKGRPSIEFKEQYKILIKERSALLKLKVKLEKSILEKQASLTLLATKLYSSREVYNEITKKAGKHLVTRWLSKLEGVDNIKEAMGVSFNKKAPIPINMITSAILNDKKLLLEKGEEVAAILNTEGRRTALLESKNNLEKIKQGVLDSIVNIEKVIAKFKKYKSSNFKDTALLELIEQLNTLNEEVDILDYSIFELENELDRNFSSIKEIDGFVNLMRTILGKIDGKTEFENSSDLNIPKVAEETTESFLDKLKKIASAINKKQPIDEKDATAVNSAMGENSGKFYKAMPYAKYIIRQMNIFGTNENLDKITKTFEEFSSAAEKEGPKNNIAGSSTTNNKLAFSEENNIKKGIDQLEISLTNLEKGKVDTQDIHILIREFNKLKDLPKENLQQEESSEAFLRDFKSTLELFDVRISDIKIKHSEEAKKGPVRTINATNIGITLSEVVKEKKRELQETALEGAKKEAKSIGIYLEDVTNKKKEIFKKGEKVFLDGVEGEVLFILKSDSSNINILIRDNQGNLHMSSFTALSKVQNNSNTLNNNQLDLFEQEKNNNAEEKNGPLIHVAPPVVIGEFKNSVVYNKDGEVVDSKYPYYEYLLEQVDKTNDTLHFSFSTSLAAAYDNSPGANNSNYYKIVGNLKAMVIELPTASNERKLEIVEFLVENMPISFKIKRADKTHPGRAGSTISRLTKANSENFHALEGEYRRALLDAWLLAGAEIETINGVKYLKGVQAVAAFQKVGSLNIEKGAREKGGNKLTDMHGISLDNMEIFALTHKKSENSYISMEGNKEVYPFKKGENQGVVGIFVKNNRGETFPLLLNQKKLEGTGELNVILDMIDNFMNENNSDNYDSIVPDEILNRLKEEVPLLFKAFGKTSLTYGEIITTLLAKNSESSQFSVVVIPGQSKLSIGDKVFDSKNYSRNEVASLLGQKYIRTGFTKLEEDNKLVIHNNKEYLEYLIETKVISSNIANNQPIFIGRIANEKYVSGVSMYLSPSDISITNSSIKKGEVIPSKKVTNIEGKKVFLRREVRAELKQASIPIKNLSQQDIIKLNSLYYKDNVSPVLDFAESIINKANKETGDTESNCK